MTPKIHVKLLRTLYSMNVDDAGRHLAATGKNPRGVNRATWQRWESGRLTPPPEVITHFVSLLTAYKAAVNDLLQADAMTVYLYNFKAPINASTERIIHYHLQLSIAALAQSMGFPIERLD